MKTKILFIFFILVLALGGCSKGVIEVKLQPEDNLSPASEEKTADDNQINKNNESSSAKTTEYEQNMSIGKEESLVALFKGAIIKTNLGDIQVEFYGDKSPKTVENFLKLSQSGFYNNTKFHRVIPDFMIQGGDPNSRDDDWSNDGLGGPGYKFDDEFNDEKLMRGSLAMANSGPDTNGSQFFIVTAAATPWLDGKHTNFGKVVKGMDIVDKIENLPRDANDHPTTQQAVIEGIELVKK